MRWIALTLMVAIGPGSGAATAAELGKKEGKPAAEVAIGLSSGAATAAGVAIGKLVGSVVGITLAEDGKSAAAVLRDSKSGEEVEIFVDDQLTLDKFKDKRISTGDEIRCKYKMLDGKKRSTYFRKVGGC